VHYQPVVDQHGAVVGAEALVRWQHPDEGMLLPAEFLPVAEASGLVVQLGQRVLLSACADAAALVAAAPGTPFVVAVNVAARQLSEPGFADGVAAVLLETGLGAERLCLEITETEMVDLGGQAMGELAAVRALGVRLAVDDFGTGYAPLTYLKRLAADVV
jgi:EAL domain-containing protein (putative c-di-GMP-specific phosphodiesterase class I)